MLNLYFYSMKYSASTKMVHEQSETYSKALGLRDRFPNVRLKCFIIKGMFGLCKKICVSQSYFSFMKSKGLNFA